ncbi:ARM repeat-containing protein [Patellaria atrata CBS 101060]|uniref:Nucleolar protein 9 n=1 Tax=Patellaria atrata CBS 101060 TaxID=1346257 RepID=A0A9P4VN57_9PEZI|nr:ARM repeat-containing protein [Patellaria atrata CBS 101060]
MPKENKRRGRREQEKKRKLEHAEEEPQPQVKRRKSSTNEELSADFIPFDAHDAGFAEEYQENGGPGELPFYGMLDEEEQEYFKRADEMLELNQFGDPEERTLFLENVYREADGKELKIANSQSCSRLMERLILLSTPEQLKRLFQKFSTHFLNLVQHRFASHCCEALFIQAAPLVTEELVNTDTSNKEGTGGAALPSIEELFLSTVKELEGNVGYLFTDRFASHTLRVLLVVLSGQPFTPKNPKSVIKSKRKEKISVAGIESLNSLTLEKRTVPDSFYGALKNIIRESVSGLDTTQLQALATHETGNPTLQLLLQIELTIFGKQKGRDEQDSLLRKLIPDNPITEDSPSATFINSMLYDTVGSRLLETIIEFAPAKVFKSLYREFFKERIGRLARNEIAGYVVCKILERLSPEDLSASMELIVPEIPSLIERNRTTVIRTLIERCAVRGLDTTPIAAKLEASYASPSGFDIARMLRLVETSPTSPKKPKEASKAPPSTSTTHSHSETTHCSLLAQTMVQTPGPLSALIFDSLIRLTPTLSVALARDPIASRTLQAALTAGTTSVIFRRKMIQHFYGHFGSLALDPSGSHVVDAIWQGTQGLAFIRERVAEELAENEASLRESGVGRTIWRNWQMDLYKRRRGDWVVMSRRGAGNDGFQSFPDGGKAGRDRSKEERKKTPLELARERHVAKKLEKQRKGK